MNEFYSKIVGVTFTMYGQEAISKLDASKDTLFVQRDFDKLHDKNAVRIYYKSIHLGYLPKDTAKTVAEYLDNGKKVTITEFTVTGDREKMKVGCNIKLKIEDK